MSFIGEILRGRGEKEALDYLGKFFKDYEEEVTERAKNGEIDWKDESWKVARICPDYLDPNLFDWKKYTRTLLEHNANYISASRMNWDGLASIIIMRRYPQMIDVNKIEWMNFEWWHFYRHAFHGGDKYFDIRNIIQLYKEYRSKKGFSLDGVDSAYEYLVNIACDYKSGATLEASKERVARAIFDRDLRRWSYMEATPGVGGPPYAEPNYEHILSTLQPEKFQKWQTETDYLVSFRE